MKDPTYNPNAIKELNEKIGKEDHVQQKWKKGAKNYISEDSKQAGMDSLKKIREELGRK